MRFLFTVSTGQMQEHCFFSVAISVVSFLVYDGVM